MSSLLPPPAVAPVNCQPWCRVGDGHRDQGSRQDQWCFGTEHRVDLSAEPTEFLGDGNTRQQYLNTYLLRQANDTAPRVFVGHGGASGKLATLEEARRFALEILTRVDGLEV